MKRCCRCKEEKDLKEFNKCKSAKDGLQYMCKICQKEHYQLNREKRKEYVQMNKETIKEYQKAYKKQYSQLNREKMRDYRKQYYHRNPEKQIVRNMLNNAVKSGKVHKPVFCSSCEGDKHLEAHHTDYTKPLEVLWLCRSCHVDLHRGLREESRNR